MWSINRSEPSVAPPVSWSLAAQGTARGRLEWVACWGFSRGEPRVWSRRPGSISSPRCGGRWRWGACAGSTLDLPLLCLPPAQRLAPPLAQLLRLSLGVTLGSAAALPRPVSRRLFRQSGFQSDHFSPSPHAPVPPWVPASTVFLLPAALSPLPSTPCLPLLSLVCSSHGSQQEAVSFLLT